MAGKIQKKHVANGLILALQAAASVVLMVQIHILAFLTVPYMVAVGVGLALLWLLCLGLLFRAKTVRKWIARVLSLLISAALVVGTIYLHDTHTTITEIVEKETPKARVAVYVLADDPAQQLADLADYDFGILETMDRDNTDAALLQMEEELGAQVLTYEYASPGELAAALLKGRAEAIVLNEAYLDVIEDMANANASEEDADTTDSEESLDEGSDTTDGEDTSESSLLDEETLAQLGDFRGRIREIAAYEIEQDSLAELPERQETEDHTIVFYVSGIDTRGSVSRVSRSDVNILVAANTETKQILMVNTPRDYYVPLSISGGTRDKLTHAGIYGVECSMETLGMLYDIDVDYYFRVNFSGFEKIIDALGGVDVYSDYNFTHEGYSFHKGTNHLSGAEALHFARDRFSFANGDIQRGEHQMRVIEAVFEKVKSPSVLSRYSSLLDSLESAFETNMTYDEIAELVRMQLSDNAEWNIVTYHVDGSGASRTTYSAPGTRSYVMVPDESTVETAKELLRQVRHGQILEQPEEEE